MCAQVKETLINSYAIRMQKLMKYFGDGRLSRIERKIVSRFVSGRLCRLFTPVRSGQIAAVKLAVGKAW